MQWARGVLGHSQRRRLVPRAAVPQVERHRSILGLGEGFDVPVVEHSTELPDLSEEVNDAAQEAEGDDEEEEAEEAALVGRLMSELDTPDSLQYLQQSIAQKRSKLQEGAIYHQSRVDNWRRRWRLLPGARAEPTEDGTSVDLPGRVV